MINKVKTIKNELISQMNMKVKGIFIIGLKFILRLIPTK